MHMREEPTQKGVLYAAQMQGGMMTWARYNDDATIIYEVATILLDQVALQLLDNWDATTLPH